MHTGAGISGTQFKAKGFPQGFRWFNTDKPLALNDLKGQIVVLDFWTYCCINCMHMLQDLEWIEKKYRTKPVVVIGIHSAKFENEKQSANVKEAIQRYEIGHPVIIDQEMSIWRSYGVTGWPTIVIIDPKGNIVYQQSGEGQRDNIDDIIEVLLGMHERNGSLAQTSLQPDIRPKERQNKAQPAPMNNLSYPGKLSFSPDCKMLAISDSNHNRVLVVETGTGRVAYRIGGRERGLLDGDFENARFFRPQGVLWIQDKGKNEDKIYVADTENHALRLIDLQSKKVSTLSGNGSQGHWVNYSQDANRARLSSPWDLAYRDNTIYIAMAGLHQIWAYSIDSQTVAPFAGSGYEGILDRSLDESQFSQPSGLAISGNYIYVADSEASAVRQIDFAQLQVRTLAGKDLFVFGYRDGNANEALFQHPLGICADGNNIYVADTYNHSIRLIDIGSHSVSTLVGRKNIETVCNIEDLQCGTLGLFEPSDVKVANSMLYIADTNNHLIRIFDPSRKALTTMKIIF
jgi:thiol-disulfide isomerase/thioredoxin/sugar lactone lactonase YvrE